MPSRRLVVTSTIVVTTALLLGAAAVTVRCKADARWSEMQAWLSQARADYQRRDFRRPVAWGTSEADLAFRHYRRAFALAPSDTDPICQWWAEAVLNRVPAGATPLTTNAIAAIKAAWAPALAAMRQGAHCADARPWLDLDQPLPMSHLLHVRWLTNLSVIEACEALDQGAPRRAVELLLDAVTLGVDLMRSGAIDRMFGNAPVMTVAMQGLSEERLLLLDREALDLLVEGLARLDDPTLAIGSPADEALVLACWLLRVPAKGDDLPETSWGYGFSRRWETADGILAMAGEAARLGDLDHRWPIREAQLEQLEEGSELLLGCWLGTLAAERSARHALTRLRLLRLSVDQHRGVALPVLPDPFGAGPLTVERTGETARFASVGKVRDETIERKVAPR